MTIHRLRDPHVDLEHPWDGDALNREQHGRILGELISSLNGPCVISVKGSWGSGKSVFLKRLAAHLERTCQIPVVTVDAWKSDYLPDPLVAFVEAIAAKVESSGPSGAAKAGDLFVSAAQIAVPVVTTASLAFGGASGPLLTAGMTGVATLATKLREQIKERKEAETTLFKRLTDARDLLTKRDKNRPLKPIAILIDELDRCRPDYAIRLLERIKHYFDVPGITFVIATDGENLPASVATVYGSHVDGERYLRKFFDYEYRLPDPSSDAFAGLLAADFDLDSFIDQSVFSRDQIESAWLDPDSSDYWNLISSKDRALDAVEALRIFPNIAKALNLSLRDQAQAFTVVNAYLRSEGSAVVAFPIPIVFGACLRYASENIYQQFRAGTFSLDMNLNPTPGSLATLPGVSVGRISPATRIYITNFLAIAQSEKPDEVVLSLRRRAEDELENRRPENYSALRRLELRCRTIRATALRTYVDRALMLVDAFASE